MVQAFKQYYFTEVSLVTREHVIDIPTKVFILSKQLYFICLKSHMLIFKRHRIDNIV